MSSPGFSTHGLDGHPFSGTTLTGSTNNDRKKQSLACLVDTFRVWTDGATFPWVENPASRRTVHGSPLWGESDFISMTYQPRDQVCPIVSLRGGADQQRSVVPFPKRSKAPSALQKNPRVHSLSSCGGHQDRIDVDLVYLWEIHHEVRYPHDGILERLHVHWWNSPDPF